VCFLSVSPVCIRVQLAFATASDAVVLCLFQAELFGGSSWNVVCSVRSNDAKALLELHQNGGAMSLFPNIKGFRV
jgi:hypothetical protein